MAGNGRVVTVRVDEGDEVGREDGVEERVIILWS